jgi:hypothetical protein
MSRQRMVKPEFFLSESMGAVSVEARLLFIGLWVAADDSGALRAQTRRIKQEVFPYDDGIRPADVARMLAELEAVGSIRAHESDDGLVVVIPKFGTYQKINRPSKPTVGKLGRQRPGALAAMAEDAQGNGMSAHGRLSEHCAEAPPGGIRPVEKYAGFSGEPVENLLGNAAFSECSMNAHPERSKEGRKESEILSYSGQWGAVSQGPPHTPPLSEERQVRDVPRMGVFQSLGSLLGGKGAADGRA